MTSVTFQPITVPAFYCPIPAACATDAAQLSSGTLDWLDRTGADLDDERRVYLAGTDIGRSASLTIPDGRTARRQLYADLLFWLYAFDDAVADESTGPLSAQTSTMLLRLTRLLETPAAAEPGPWFVTAMDDLLARLAGLAGPEQTRRCAEHLRAYVLNVALAVSRRGTGITPTLNDYVISRLGESAVQVVTTMIPIVGGYELSPADVADPRVVALVEMVNFLTSWDNDIIGYNKETYRSLRYGYPAVPCALTLLAHEHDCSVEQAIGTAVAYRDRVMGHFLRRSAEVTASASASLARYVEGLGRWVRGYLDWALATNRFTDPRNPTDDLVVDRFAVSTAWAPAPVDDLPGPLPIPTIAWWWDPPRRAER